MAARNSKAQKHASVSSALYRKEPPRKSGDRYEANLVNFTRRIGEEGRQAVYLIAESMAIHA